MGTSMDVCFGGVWGGPGLVLKINEQVYFVDHGILSYLLYLLLHVLNRLYNTHLQSGKWFWK